MAHTPETAQAATSTVFEQSWTTVDSKPTITTKSYVRTRGKNADILISSDGIIRTQVQRHETVTGLGKVIRRHTFPFDPKYYCLTDQINRKLEGSERKDLLACSWVQIEVEFSDINGNNVESVLKHLSKLRAHFFSETRHLKVKLGLRHLSASSISKTTGFSDIETFRKSDFLHLLEQLADRLLAFTDLEHLHVIVEVPSSISESELYVQIFVALPFYRLQCSKREIKLCTPSTIPENLSKKYFTFLTRQIKP
ncbi:uncharacterized protein LY89DRAFT_790614 [Mollisia scopiformis]|uniref:Uncharacterized protein n=1 Tax=Mollisia scopiformis TaxID=149040 RepID=A0A132B335_MOLSC|nr:uncharacterized protein LY89DRAFT_790614 [Mollisia scopiformis]KUJ06324.1 hypothetical protein LY89DRAFT_790614 [Mollisia scopiformis]